MFSRPCSTTLGPLAVLIGLALLCLPGCGSRATELDGLAAWTRIDRDAPSGSPPLVDDTGGLRLAGNLSRTFLTPRALRGDHGNGLRLNLNFSSSTYSRDLDGRTVGQPPATAGTGEADLWLLSPQIGPSFRLAIPVGDDGGAFYIEPGITGGAVYGSLAADYSLAAGGSVDTDDWDVSWAYRPYLRIGYVSSLFVVGVEGGWETSGLRFDIDEGDDPESWYVGGFLGIRLSR